jgi:GNAT superfamily N-acetyltransferase
VHEVRLSSEPQADEATQDLVRDPLDEGNMVITGWRDYHPVAVFLRDEADTVRGGILGHCWGRWLHVEYLWVAEELRGQDYGSRLLAAAEDEARAHGCLGVFLDTFDFQAPGFYPKYGYEVYAELQGHPPGHTLYYLRKDLV